MMSITKNPSKQVYSVVMEYILSNADIAGVFKPVNITRYDKPVSNKYPYKHELIIAEDVAVLDTPSKSNPRTFMQPAAGGIRFKRLNNNGDPEHGTCRSTDGLDG